MYMWHNVHMPPPYEACKQLTIMNHVSCCQPLEITINAFYFALKISFILTSYRQVPESRKNLKINKRGGNSPLRIWTDLAISRFKHWIPTGFNGANAVNDLNAHLHRTQNSKSAYVFNQHIVRVWDEIYPDCYLLLEARFVLQTIRTHTEPQAWFSQRAAAETPSFQPDQNQPPSFLPVWEGGSFFRAPYISLLN